MIMRSLLINLNLLFLATTSCAVTHIVRVYIHGTCHSDLSLLNPTALRNDDFDGTSDYEMVLAQSRTDGFMEKSDLMGPLGFHDVTESLKGFETIPEKKHKAALHILRAFDELASTREQSEELRVHYYLFGWMGLMSETCRDASSEELYDHLLTLKKKLEKNGDVVDFELYSHSHGGQLVLHLAHIREQRGDRDFVIKQAILSACPFYQTKARHAASGMFKVIINMYSESDMVQVGDCISIPDDSCFHTFKEAGIIQDFTGPLVVDARLMVHQHEDIFGHASFTILDRYSFFNASRQESKIIQEILDTIKPLPLIVLYPLLVADVIKSIEQRGHVGYQHIDINFDKEDANLIAQILHTETGSVIGVTQFPSDVVQAARNRTEKIYRNAGYNSEMRKSLHNLIYVWEVPVRKMRGFIVTINKLGRKYAGKFYEAFSF